MTDAREADPWSPQPPWNAELAFAFVAADFTLILFLSRVVSFPWVLGARFAAAALFTALFLALRNGRRASVGLALGRPAAGLRNAGLIVGLVAFLLAAGGGVVFLLRVLGMAVPLPPVSSSITAQWWSAALTSVVAFPVLEEWIYRGILYPPLERRAGRLWAFGLSGLVFFALHVAYGKPYPHYALGGILLAWSFQRGRSLLWPVLLHALWNLLNVAGDWVRVKGWIVL